MCVVKNDIILANYVEPYRMLNEKYILRKQDTVDQTPTPILPKVQGELWIQPSPQPYQRLREHHGSNPHPYPAWGPGSTMEERTERT